MKAKATSSIFILFAIAAGIVAMTPAAFAGNSEITIVPVAGSQTLGCEDLDGCYTPSVATIDAGGKVIFSNTDGAAHTFTGGNAFEGPSEKFDSGFLAAGQSYTLDTADLELGEYDYFCMVHPWMLGSLIVQVAEETLAVDDVEAPIVDDVEAPVVDDVEIPVVDLEEDYDDGGCLIATAAYGTELAPQVQLLREIRDNVLFSTASGASFMSGFNTIYYTFAPTVSDWQRENQPFKEFIRVAITPGIHILGLMNFAEPTDESVAFFGISTIGLLSVMYVAGPIVLIKQIHKKTRHNN